MDELSVSASNRPDGTVKDSLRMARGYWEAKDSHDDLDAEIRLTPWEMVPSTPARAL